MAKAKKQQPRVQYVQDQSQYIPQPQSKGSTAPLVPKSDGQKRYLNSLKLVHSLESWRTSWLSGQCQ